MSFPLQLFLPYLLNQAAESVSGDFQKNYRDRFGMLRTEWRVLFHLGVYGQMTAKGICDNASLHKTKVSRAIKALEQKRYLKRDTDPDDLRVENLSLTPAGKRVFLDLQNSAMLYEQDITKCLTETELKELRATLQKLLLPR